MSFLGSFVEPFPQKEYSCIGKESHFRKHHNTSIDISIFLGKSSLNLFDLVKDQIKSVNTNISKQELMIKFMEILKEQFFNSLQPDVSSFSKDDQSMPLVTDSEEEEYVLALESQLIGLHNCSLNTTKLN